MRRGVRNKSSILTSETLAGWLFLLPSICGVAIFVLIPFLETLRRSFSNTLGTQWVGLHNYQSVVTNDAFSLATRNTVRFICTCLPLLLGLSLIIALFLHSRPLQKTSAAKTYKTTFLLPMAIPVASIVLLWQTLFSEKGLMNALLHFGNFHTVDFMGTSAAFWVLIATYLWKNCGYDSILWITGLDEIPEDLYEASRVDGANGWQQFFFITLPNLLPTLMMITILSLLNTFKVFREAYLVAGGYPKEKSIYLLQHLFNNWFLNLDLPRLTAAAVLVALSLLAVILALVVRWEHYNKSK